MNKREFALFAAAIKTYYPREEKLIPNNQAMALWFHQLQDITYEVAEAALNRWVAVNKWSPSIADIRAEAARIQQGDIPEWSEGWERAVRAIRRYGSYNKAEAMASLDDLTRQTVERLGYMELCMSENVTADRANFRMIYEQLAERKRKEEQTPAALLVLIERMREQKRIGG